MKVEPGPLPADWLRLFLRMPLQGPDGPFDLELALGVERGAFVAIAGPSGAGKTTLMRLIAGLARPSEGTLRVGDETWCDTVGRIHLPTRKRSIGVVFQDYALFPNMSVRGNVEYAIGRRPDAGWVDELLRLVRLERLQDRSPEALSGGQRQRLALIRALARKPSILILDEPLSALDPALRGELQAEVLRLHRRFGTTTLMVSHDTAEIVRMADRLVRMDAGRIVFDGHPLAACGADASIAGIRVIGQHLDGPDALGRARVLVDGRTVEVRYRDAQPGPDRAETVLLVADEVQVRRGIFAGAGVEGVDAGTAR
ncbi:MAG: ATP-binding cassette domain-containing protein [Burkholderiaceae bacterium]|nr:ATP-binding cassette domain-containing protein [Burkholderiaceae bacterium]